MQGDITQITTMRYYWGCFWQQGLRSVISLYTGAFLRFFRIKKGTTSSKYAQLYVAFVVSGAMHVLLLQGLPTIHGLFDPVSVNMMLALFMQAPAIHAEDILIATCKRLGFRTGTWFTGIVGRLWVVTWIVFSMQYYEAPTTAMVALDGRKAVTNAKILAAWWKMA